MDVRTWRCVVVFGAGLLLGAAAILKLMSPPKWLGCWLGLSATAWAMLAGVELLLGLFLVAFPRHPSAWLSATVFFGLALVTTGLLAYRGSASCGCLGAVFGTSHRHGGA